MIRNHPNVSRLIEFLAFIIAFIIISTNIMNTLIVKGDPVGPRMQSVYEGYAKGTDVLFAGSSHTGQLLTRNLWQDYGISTYTVAGDSQPVDIMYHSIVEFLKYQKPKVLMVETALIPDDSLHEPDTNYNGKTTNDAVFRYSINYLQMAIEQVKRYKSYLSDDGVALIYKWPLMHDRYKSLTKDDFVIDKPYLSTDTAPIYSTPDEEVNYVTTDNREPLSRTGQLYLEKIIKLCQKQNIQLVLFHTPYPAPEMSLAQQNTISDIAAENNIPFIDFNYLLDEIEFDPQVDQARDLSHLNYYGSEKVTGYLGKYLKDNYALEDHRHDPAYDNWNKDLEAWQDLQVKKDFESINEISTWSELLSSHYKDYVIILTLSGNYQVDPDGLLAEFLESLPVPKNFFDKGGSVILDHGTVSFYSGDETTYAFSKKYGNAIISVDRHIANAEFVSGTPSANDNDGVYIYNNNYIKAVNGLDITIFNDRLDYIVDSVCVDAYTNGTSLFRDKIQY